MTHKRRKHHAAVDVCGRSADSLSRRDRSQRSECVEDHPAGSSLCTLRVCHVAKQSPMGQLDNARLQRGQPAACRPVHSQQGASARAAAWAPQTPVPRRKPNVAPICMCPRGGMESGSRFECLSDGGLPELALPGCLPSHHPSTQDSFFATPQVHVRCHRDKTCPTSNLISSGTGMMGQRILLRRQLKETRAAQQG